MGREVAVWGRVVRGVLARRPAGGEGLGSQSRHLEEEQSRPVQRPCLKRYSQCDWS